MNYAPVNLDARALKKTFAPQNSPIRVDRAGARISCSFALFCRSSFALYPQRGKIGRTSPAGEQRKKVPWILTGAHAADNSSVANEFFRPREYFVPGRGSNRAERMKSLPYLLFLRYLLWGWMAGKSIRERESGYWYGPRRDVDFVIDESCYSTLIAMSFYINIRFEEFYRGMGFGFYLIFSGTGFYFYIYFEKSFANKCQYCNSVIFVE